MDIKAMQIICPAKIRSQPQTQQTHYLIFDHIYVPSILGGGGKSSEPQLPYKENTLEGSEDILYSRSIQAPMTRQPPNKFSK